MPPLRRVALLVSGFIAWLTYVWFAAVRLAPRVLRRKRARRR